MVLETLRARFDRLENRLRGSDDLLGVGPEWLQETLADILIKKNPDPGRGTVLLCETALSEFMSSEVFFWGLNCFRPGESSTTIITSSDLVPVTWS